jgi:hypothetical protein
VLSLKRWFVRYCMFLLFMSIRILSWNVRGLNNPNVWVVIVLEFS